MLLKNYIVIIKYFTIKKGDAEKFMRVTILTNGPGELWGWVRPVVSELRKRGHTISLWLLPCQFSSGYEREAASFLGVDKLEGPSGTAGTWQNIIHEKTDKIIQLGGDIIFGLRMAKAGVLIQSR